MNDHDLRTLNGIGILAKVPAHYRSEQSLNYPPPPGCAYTQDVRDLRLSGPNGTGKTTFGTNQFMRWVRQTEWREQLPLSHQYVTSRWIAGSELIDDVKAGFDNKRHRAQDWMRPALLLIDDALSGRATDFEISEIEKVITGRINRGLPTIITTNLDLQEIDALSSRLGSRIAAWRDHWIGGNDHRAEGA